MKMKGAKQVHYDAGPNMTPLVDVVMVILIFLMLAGKFGQNEHYLASTIPIRQHGSGNRTDAVPNDVDFHIQVDSLPDRFQARVEGVDEPINDKDTLTKVLSEKLAAYLSIGKTPDNVQILIGPGRTVKYNYLIQVYEAALAAQSGEGSSAKHFTKVAFEPSH
jgi:biopolymer transport protein ExbD